MAALGTPLAMTNGARTIVEARWKPADFRSGGRRVKAGREKELLARSATNDARRLGETAASAVAAVHD